MTAPEEAARLLAEAIGAGVTLLAAKPWQLREFTGLRMLIEADVDLPADVGEREVGLPGYVIADLASITPRRAEVLLIEA